MTPASNVKTAGTPWALRGICFAVMAAAVAVAYAVPEGLGSRGRACCGVIAFFSLAALFSHNLRAVSVRTIFWGIVLQLFLAFLVLKGSWEVNGQTYSVYNAFERVGDVINAFIGFANKGAEFVFGDLAGRIPAEDVVLQPGKSMFFVFAFKALPSILFVSAFFTVLYHFGVLQWCVRMLAKVMIYLMGTSGAETLSVSANVFMGQTEAPLIVKPYVPRMTNSELFALMVSGMAHISGAMMAVYVSYGANPVAVLTTCIMACPCSLYLSKLVIPETITPETGGDTKMQMEKSNYVNAIDAAAAGTGDGLRLALNVAAMLIVFIAFVAMFDGLLGLINTRWFVEHGWFTELPEKISLQWIFGQIFSPVAYLMGVDVADQSKVGSLLGTKLALNEHVAFLRMKMEYIPTHAMSERSFKLAAFALTGFANFASVGIQIGGIGAMAPERRHDLARLGMWALFIGFTATLINASVAGILIP